LNPIISAYSYLGSVLAALTVLLTTVLTLTSKSGGQTQKHGDAIFGALVRQCRYLIPKVFLFDRGKVGKKAH
jgi:hypothetical protein